MLTAEQKIILVLLKYNDRDQPCPFAQLKQKGICPHWTWTGDEYQFSAPEEWREAVLQGGDEGDDLPCETRFPLCLLLTARDIAKKLTPEDELRLLNELGLSALQK